MAFGNPFPATLLGSDRVVHAENEAHIQLVGPLQPADDYLARLFARRLDDAGGAATPDELLASPGNSSFLACLPLNPAASGPLVLLPSPTSAAAPPDDGAPAAYFHVHISSCAGRGAAAWQVTLVDATPSIRFGLNAATQALDEHARVNAALKRVVHSLLPEHAADRLFEAQLQGATSELAATSSFVSGSDSTPSGQSRSENGLRWQSLLNGSPDEASRSTNGHSNRSTAAGGGGCVASRTASLRSDRTTTGCGGTVALAQATSDARASTPSGRAKLAADGARLSQIGQLGRASLTRTFSRQSATNMKPPVEQVQEAGAGAADSAVALSNAVEARKLISKLERLDRRNAGDRLGLGQLSHHHEEVSLLFSDICGYTSFCNKVAPGDVMAYLNTLFSRFDALVRKWRVYKVETVGDAFIVAGGVMKHQDEAAGSIRSASTNVTGRLDDVPEASLSACATVESALALDSAATHEVPGPLSPGVADLEDLDSYPAFPAADDGRCRENQLSGTSCVVVPMLAPARGPPSNKSADAEDASAPQSILDLHARLDVQLAQGPHPRVLRKKVSMSNPIDVIQCSPRHLHQLDEVLRYRRSQSADIATSAPANLAACVSARLNALTASLGVSPRASSPKARSASCKGGELAGSPLQRLHSAPESQRGYTVRTDVERGHAVRTLLFAIEASQVASETLNPLGEPTKMRFGLHLGPVTSGLVGTVNSRFCLFGDTMNTASRMESTAPYPAIQASEAFAAAVPWAPWVKRQPAVEVKGKGIMTTYLLPLTTLDCVELKKQLKEALAA